MTQLNTVKPLISETARESEAAAGHSPNDVTEDELISQQLNDIPSNYLYQ